MYLVVFFSALRVKIRQDGVVRNKAVYLERGMGEALAVVYPATTLQTCT
jgi:hypothetical protein